MSYQDTKRHRENLNVYCQMKEPECLWGGWGSKMEGEENKSLII